jgi:hypothetical protein
LIRISINSKLTEIPFTVFNGGEWPFWQMLYTKTAGILCYHVEYDNALSRKGKRMWVLGCGNYLDQR